MDVARVSLDQAAIARAEDQAATMRVCLSLDGRLLTTTARLCAWLGRSEQLLLDLPFAGQVLPDDRAGFDRALRSLEPGGSETASCELRLQHADGPPLQACLELTLIRDDAGRPLALLGDLRDTGPVHAAERVSHEARQRSEFLLQRILDTIPVGVWVADREGRIFMSNPAGVEIWAEAHHAEVERFREFKGWWADSGERLDSLDWAMARALMRGEVSRDEVIDIEAFDGTRKTILNSALPLRDDAGNLIGAIATNLDITRQRRLELELRRREQQFREIFAGAPIGMALVGLDGRFLHVNHAYCKITGYSERELLDPAMRFSNLTHPDDLEENLKALGRLAAGEVPNLFYEKRYLRKGGEPVWVRVSATLRPERDDEAAQIFALVEDIEQRKRVESFLQMALDREQRAREEAEEGRRILDALMEHAPVGIAIADAPDVFIRRVSHYGRELTGRPPEVIEHIPAPEHAAKWDVYAADGVTPAQPEDLPLTRATQNGEMVSNEVWVLRNRQGEQVPILCNAAPIRDRDGRISGGIVVWRDIGDLRAKEAALRESEERFRTLADNIAQFAWMADSSGWIFWYNRRWFDYTGTTLKEMEGWGWQKVHHPEHVQRVTAKISKAFASGTDWEDTFPLRGRDGSYRWFLSRAIPIRDEAGRVVRWFGTNTDITDLQNAQAELHARSEELSRANAELEQFAYVVSHDLKAPLRAVAHLAHWVDEDLGARVDAENRERLRLLQERVGRMDQLIDGLLAYARLGAPPPEPTAVPLRDELEVLSRDLAIPAGFKLVLEEPLPAVRADPLHLRQIFQNLVRNAIEHHDRDTGTVRVRARDEGGFWRIEVLDNGPGIPAALQSTAFRMFATGAAKDHTGIGLAVVKKLVESYGGTIAFGENHPRGARFVICWPK